MKTYDFKKTVKFAKRVGIIAALGFMPFVVKAAVQGSMGTTSTGSINIFINVEEEVQISDLQDYVNANWNGNPYQFEEDFCVFSNAASNKYTVTVTGTNNEARFLLVNSLDPSHPVPYTATYTDAANTETALVPGTRLISMVGSGNPSCNGGRNTKIKITVGSAQSLAGIYAGTVNVLVTPE